MTWWSLFCLFEQDEKPVSTQARDHRQQLKQSSNLHNYL